MSWPFSSYCVLGLCLGRFFVRLAAASGARQATRIRIEHNTFSWITISIRIFKIKNAAVCRQLVRLSVSMIARVRRGSVRPLGHRNDELGHWLRSTIKMCSQQNRGVSAKRGCTPSVSVFHGAIKHEMGRAVPASAVKKPLLREHIGHPARLEGGQFPSLNRGPHTLVPFIFRFSLQSQFRPYKCDRQQPPASLRVVANRTEPLRVPKLRTVFELVHPRAVYVADKAVLAFDRSFIALPSEDHNCGVLRKGWRSRASRQGDFGIAAHKVLIEGRHAGGIRILGVSCAYWPRRAQYGNQRKSSECD